MWRQYSRLKRDGGAGETDCWRGPAQVDGGGVREWNMISSKEGSASETQEHAHRYVEE